MALSVAVAFPTFMGGAFAGIRFHGTKSHENHKAKRSTKHVWIGVCKLKGRLTRKRR